MPIKFFLRGKLNLKGVKGKVKMVDLICFSLTAIDMSLLLLKILYYGQRRSKILQQ